MSENRINKKSPIKSLNLMTGEVLTLEKAQDRMEFEALPVLNPDQSKCALDIYGGDSCHVNL